MWTSFIITFFYLFGGLSLLSAILVILSTNPVYSALFLISVFFNTALVVLLLDLEFLSLVFILIYVGAIMVLFLFIIMMLDIKFSKVYLNMYYYFILSGLLLFILASEFIYFLSKDFFVYLTVDPLTYLNWHNLVIEASTFYVFGTYLYTNGFFFFYLPD